MMEEWIQEFAKETPAVGAIVAIVWMGMRWHERISSQWAVTLEKIDERHIEIARQFVDSVKEIGEKCHAAHHTVAKMFYEQSCKGQEVLGQVAVHMSHFAKAQEELSRAVREISRT